VFLVNQLVKRLFLFKL